MVDKNKALYAIRFLILEELNMNYKQVSYYEKDICQLRIFVVVDVCGKKTCKQR